jgi:pSer/pThr/pTyr-binding forkhead associated (FHA) protein
LKRGGELSEVVFEFGYPAVVGRFDPSIGPIDVDLGTIPEGAYVSRRHAKLTLEDGQASVTDMGSSNGTYVVGESGEFERVEFAAVNDGQEVAFGNARFIFHLIGG